MPLHVKAALWTCDKAASDTTTVRKAEAMLAGANLKKGDAVTYVKMTNPTAALPLGMFAPADNAAMKWNAPKTFQDKLERCDIVEFGKTTCSVDVEKYVTLVIATFNPILEPLGIELQAKKSKKTHKQQKPDNNLDVFFQEDTA